MGRFAHPDLPRALSRELSDAGLTLKSVEPLVLLNPVYDPETYSVAHFDIVANFVTATSALTADDLLAWQEDLQTLGSEGRYFFSLNRYVFLAEKRL